MLPMEAWDRAGMVLTFGLIPLLIANIIWNHKKNLLWMINAFMGICV